MAVDEAPCQRPGGIDKAWHQHGSVCVAEETSTLVFSYHPFDTRPQKSPTPSAHLHPVHSQGQIPWKSEMLSVIGMGKNDTLMIRHSSEI